MLKSIASIIICSALIASTASLAGCNYKELAQKSDTDYGSRKEGDPKTVGIQAYGTRSNDPNRHNNAFFEYSSLLSRKVTDLNGVGSAIVMLTDKNAYAAILLDSSAVGTLSSGDRMNQNNSSSKYNSLFSVNDFNNISHELKQSIATKIREFAPNVHEVHISANMEFNTRFIELAKEAWGGRPLAPWIDQFNIIVQHQFVGGNVMPSPIVDLKSKPAP